MRFRLRAAREKLADRIATPSLSQPRHVRLLDATSELRPLRERTTITASHHAPFVPPIKVRRAVAGN